MNLFKWGHDPKVKKTDLEDQAEVIYIDEREVALQERELKLGHKLREEELEAEISALKKKLDHRQEERKWKIEKATQEVKDKMSKQLVEADLARVDAEARLEAYEKFDSKEDHEAAMEHLNTLIGSLAEMIKNPQTYTPPDIHINVPRSSE